MPTDREFLKYQQSGQLQTSGATSPTAAVGEAHSRQKNFTIYSSANAATNVTETPVGTLRFKGKLTEVKLTVPTTNIATSATDYALIKVYKRDNAGANQALIATYNTGPAAVTLRVPAAFTLDNTTNVIVAGTSLLTYEVIKGGAGKAIDQYSCLDLTFEEM